MAGPVARELSYSDRHLPRGLLVVWYLSCITLASSQFGAATCFGGTVALILGLLIRDKLLMEWNLASCQPLSYFLGCVVA